MKCLCIALIVLVMQLVGGAYSRAEVVMGSDSNPYIFKVEDKIVTPAEAVKSADSHEVTRCTPIKGATTAKGDAAVAYKCKVVVLEYSPKSGIPHWKVK